MSQATGVSDPDLALKALERVARTFPDHEGPTPPEKLNLALAALSELQARDPLEGMLLGQMVATNNLAMTSIRRATEATDPDVIAKYTEQVTKLTRTYTAQLEVLNKHRGKGQQKMTVEHVHVHAGGQAVVGNVSAMPAVAETVALPASGRRGE
jgi:hypothetical protein